MNYLSNGATGRGMSKSTRIRIEHLSLRHHAPCTDTAKVLSPKSTWIHLNTLIDWLHPTWDLTSISPYFCGWQWLNLKSGTYRSYTVDKEMVTLKINTYMNTTYTVHFSHIYSSDLTKPIKINYLHLQCTFNKRNNTWNLHSPHLRAADCSLMWSELMFPGLLSTL
jgi:hypothetical protein